MREIWDWMTGTQKKVFAGIVLVIGAMLIAGWIDAVRYRSAFKQSQRDLDLARRDAKSALKTAADIADKMKAVNQELKKLEEKRSEEFQKLDRDARAVRSLRDDYDRAVREPLGANAAELGELCGELADLGYPCR